MKKFIVAAGAATLSMSLLVACGSESDSRVAAGTIREACSLPVVDIEPAPATATVPEGPWIFTDDLGTEIALDAAPERMVVQSSLAAALTDLGLGDRIVGVFGPVENADGNLDSQVAGLDAAAVTDVTGGGEYGSIDLEALTGLEPDLVLTTTYLQPELWYINDTARERLTSAFPLAVVSLEGKTLPQIFDSTERLAAALGADESSFADGRAAFAEAGQRLVEADAAAGHPTFVAASPSPDVMYVSNPDVNPDLAYYRDELDLDITTPESTDQGGYFETLSWENANQYPADVIVWDDRVGSAGCESFGDQPVFMTLAAAQDLAFIPWSSVAPPSARGYAGVLERFATQLEDMG